MYQRSWIIKGSYYEKQDYSCSEIISNHLLKNPTHMPRQYGPFKGFTPVVQGLKIYVFTTLVCHDVKINLPQNHIKSSVHICGRKRWCNINESQELWARGAVDFFRPARECGNHSLMVPNCCIIIVYSCL